jgi:hypothetical protein
MKNTSDANDDNGKLVLQCLLLLQCLLPSYCMKFFTALSINEAPTIRTSSA